MFLRSIVGCLDQYFSNLRELQLVCRPRLLCVDVQDFGIRSADHFDPARMSRDSPSNLFLDSVSPQLTDSIKSFGERFVSTSLVDLESKEYTHFFSWDPWILSILKSHHKVSPSFICVSNNSSRILVRDVI